MNYDLIKQTFGVQLKHITPLPYSCDYEDDTGIYVDFYKYSHNHHDNFKAVQLLWETRENDMVECPDEYHIWRWYMDSDDDSDDDYVSD